MATSEQKWLLCFILAEKHVLELVSFTFIFPICMLTKDFKKKSWGGTPYLAQQRRF